MSTPKSTLPLSRTQAIDMYFMEHRAKLIDIAAFLDRLDRAGTDKRQPEDFRIAAFRDALGILSDGQANRARRVLELFSDHSADPIAKAPMKGALGACPTE